MPTVVEINGYAIRVFTKDHGNAHVHVFHDGSLMKIWLHPIAFDSYKGRKPRALERAEALRLVAEHRNACLAEWKRLYG